MPQVLPLALANRHPGRIHPALDSVRSTLTAAGNPQERLASVAIAGTNGKGSTAAMVDRILSAHGLRTGLYTSPHLIRLEERIRLEGREVGADALRAVLDRLVVFPQLSFFETVTVAALILFADAGLSWAILEAGMGGRWDATRAANPIIVGLTNVGTDHTRWLGTTREEIAAEKGALAAEAEVTVLGPGIDRAILPSLGVRDPVWATDLVTATPLAPGRAIIELDELRFEVGIPLGGHHQLDNLVLAVALAHEVCRLHGTPALSAESVQEGLAAVRWPGRLATVRIGRRTVLVDGAHNLEAATALARHLGEQPVRRNLLFSCLDDKPAAAMARVLRPVVEQIVLCTLADERAASIDDLVAAFPEARVAADPMSALALLPDPVVAAGSLRLVGLLLEHASPDPEPDTP